MDGLAMVLHKDLHKNVDKVNQLQTTIEAKITPIKQLEIVGNYSYYYMASNAMNRTVNLEYSQVPGEILVLNSGMGENKLYERINTNTFNSTNVFATYTDTYAENHNLKVMVGANYEQKNLKDVMLTGYDLMSDTLNDQNLIGTNAAGEKSMETDGAQNQYATMGFFGRLNYDYMGKYLFELSGRYDGTSRFPRNQRWGFFPSASVGWRVSEEDFFDPLKGWWNNFKVRYSYGSLGNQQVGYYDYIREISLSTQSYLFGGAQPLTSSIGNPVSSTFTWETVNQHNLGLDMGFLSNRLSFTAEAYIRDTKNMLTTGDSLPATYGASSPKTNNADLRTKGYELSISWKDMFMLAGKPFEYNASVHFNDYVTHITRFNNPDKSFSKSYYVGMKYGDIWGYTVDGFFATDEEAASYPVDQNIVNKIINASAGSEKGLKAGDLKYVDLNGNGKIDIGENTADDPGDRRIIGNSKPRYQYGINLGFNWMGFDFSMFFQGIGKIDWYPGADARSFWGPYARPYMTFIPKDFHTLYWTEENPDAYFPRPRGYIAMNTERALGAVNTKYLQNIGYCRLKNLTLGYSLPQTWMKKANIDGIRVYFTGENLGYFAPGLHSDYIDPEMAMTNGNLRIYPWQKTFMFGVDITF
jgi:TonB-linked SusC/RagA family outer membrane protein